MNVEEIRAAISADQNLIALIHDTDELARRLSVNRVRIVSRLIGRGDVLRVMGLVAGSGFLDVIQGNPEFRHVWPLIADSRLDIGDPLVRSHVGMLATAGVIAQPDADVLLALANVPDPVGEIDVRLAIYADDGTVMI